MQEKMRQFAFKNYFTYNARRRLSNIKLVKPNVYNKILDTVIAMARNNDLDGVIDEENLIAFLSQINKKKDNNIKFRRF